MAKQRELGENIVNHGKTGRIKEKHRKIWENRGKQGESGENIENTRNQSESGDNIEKQEKLGRKRGNIERHEKTGRIRGKHRKPLENRENQRKT